MAKRFNKRADLANYLAEKGYTTNILSRVARNKMTGMTDEEQESLPGNILQMIKNCKTEQEVISILEEQGML